MRYEKTSNDWNTDFPPRLQRKSKVTESGLRENSPF